MKSLLLSTLVLTVWFTILFWWTHGFTTFTTYSYTLKAAGDLPRALPKIKLINHNNEIFNLNDLEGKYILVQYMYLSCPTVCGIISSKIHHLVDRVKNLVPSRLILMSISFNPDLDNPNILMKSWNSFGAKKGTVFSTFYNTQNDKIALLLKEIGVWIYKKPDGEYNHTTSLFLIDPKGYLINVIDADQDIDQIVKRIEEAIE